MDSNETLLNEIRALRAQLADDGKRHMTWEQVQALGSNEWIAIPADDRARIMREVQEERRQQLADLPRESDQERRTRLFDEAMTDFSSRVAERDAARAQRAADRDAYIAAQLRPADPFTERVETRQAMAEANDRIMRQRYGA